MPGLTTNYSFPKPLGSEAANGPLAVGNLADAVDTQIKTIRDADYNGTTGHDHSGVNGHGPVLPSGSIATTLTGKHFTSPVVDSGGLTVTAGGITISAGGLSVGAAPNDVYAGSFLGSPTATHSFGVLVRAGTGTAAEVVFAAQNQAGSTTWFQVYGDGQVLLGGAGSKLGYFGNPPVSRQTITGSRSGGAALQNLLIALGLSQMGMIVDATTA